MVRVIVSAVLLVLLAVLVAFNIRSTTSISLFGASFDDVPTMALALVSFAVGVVYSLFLYVSRYLHRRKRKGLEKKDKALSQRERELTARESAVASAAESPPEGPSETDISTSTQPERKSPRFWDRLKFRG
ncbi:MAG: LapA family protein [Spirochaetia bacterium]|jgi:uncharacterized integral membrane protein